MAAASATFVISGFAAVGAAASRSSSSSAAVRGLTVARFSGLRACPMVRRRGITSRPAVPVRRLTTKAAADEHTLTTVQSIIAKQLALSTTKVLPESKFADLGADSLDTVEIMMALEEEFKVSLDEDGAEKVTTVQEAADLIYSFVKQ